MDNLLGRSWRSRGLSDEGGSEDRQCSIGAWGGGGQLDGGVRYFRCVALWELFKLSLGAIAVVLRFEPLALTVALVDALVLSADVLGLSAGATDRCTVAKVGVDADQIRSHSKGLDVLDDNLAGRLLAVVGAVTA